MTDSFCLLYTSAKKILGKDQSATSAPITIERDQDPSGEPTPVETMAETTGEGIRSEDLKDEVEKIVGDAMEKYGIGGTLKVLGTPAEENGSGKITMLDEGIFDLSLIHI